MAIRRDDDLPTNFQWAFKRRRKCPLPPSLSWHSHMFGCCRLLLLLFTLKENNTGAPQRTAPIGKNNRNSSYFSLSPRGYIYFRHMLSLEIIQTWAKEQRKSSNFKLKRIYEKCKFVFLVHSSSSFIHRMTMALKIVVPIFILALPFLMASNSDSV